MWVTKEGGTSYPGLTDLQSLNVMKVFQQRRIRLVRTSGSISLFEWPEWSPSKSNAGGRHAKAEASFAHSKRCREVRLLLQTLRLRHGWRFHDARKRFECAKLGSAFRCNQENCS